MDTLRNNYSTKKKEQCHQIILPTDCTGWAINWNPFKIGELLAGDDKGCISVYVNDESYTSWSKAAEYSYHESSVEDVIYSPQQSHVFASCRTHLIQAHRMALSSW